jgi:hypothetical protein
MFWSPDSIRPSIDPVREDPPVLISRSTILAISTVSNGQKDHMQTGLRNLVLGLAETQLDAAFIGLDRVDRLHKPETDQTQRHDKADNSCRRRTRSRHRPEAPGATCPDRAGSVPQGPADCRRPVAAVDPCPMVPDRCHHHCRRRPKGRRRLRSDCSRASRPLSKRCYVTRRKKPGDAR